MPPAPAHRIIAADAYRVPAPFRAFAVRSDEHRHAFEARSPYGRVHQVGTEFLDAPARASLAAAGYARVRTGSFSDIDHARTTWAELAAAAPGAPDLLGHIARALQVTGVLGAGIASYRRCLARRVDYLATCGAGFHNDVSRHWSRCLFWLLALDATEVELVLPHAGVRLALASGDLVVFDQTMAHGLCRPADGGQAVAASFGVGAHRHQMFLTGELRLTDVQWAALNAPWLAVEAHAGRGALDLRVAAFDERSGAIQQLRALRHCMQRSTGHVGQQPQRLSPPALLRPRP